MTTNQLTRLKVLIDDYFFVFAAVLAILVAAGGWTTYSTVVDPGTHVEERTAASWSVDGGFDHRGRVVENSLIFQKNETRENRMFYITNSTPRLNTTYWFKLGGENGSADVHTRVSLVDFAHYEQEAEESEEVIQRRIWEERRLLDVKNDTLKPGERQNVSFKIDADALRKRTKRLHERHKSLYQISQIRTQVFVTTTINGTVDSHPVNRQFNYTLPINSTMDYFVVSPTRSPVEQMSVTQQTTVPNQPGTAPQVGSIALLILSLVSLGGLCYGRWDDRFVVSESVRTELQNSKIQSEFEDWITIGTVPQDDPQTTIEVDSLEGLVDVAFDTNRRVIEDESTGVYFVQDADIWYRYTPHWLDDNAADDEIEASDNPGSDDEQ
ncbi:DUF5305 family protein [Halocatena halophila]|uniref:DUF5305 family protein n=1 Tax=Halocatena halophila TaxID=2814576 RepID=UPI002ED157F6